MLRLPQFIRRSTYTTLAIATTMTIVASQSIPAQAFNLGDLLPRILPGIIETVQISTMSAEQEMATGKQINDQLTQKQFKLLQDPAMNSYINQIGQRVAAYSKRKDITFTFQVVDDDNINAAATMGGYVYVNKGTIKAADNEAQLASVIAHEVAHIENKHTIEQAKNDSLARTGAAALKLDQNTLVGLVAQYGLNMPRSRRFESNADMDGLRMVRDAGYAQQPMVEFMKKLDNGQSMPKWLSDHPQTQDRIKALNLLIQKNPSTKTDGTDTIAYARRVGKPIPVVAPAAAPKPTQLTPTKAVTPVVTPPAAPAPAKVTPAPVVVPTKGVNGIIVPTE